MVNIRLSVTPEERRDVYRFRYSVYVEEMRLQELYADHAEKSIADPLDGPQARVLAGWGR